jgi:methylamine methyltransferase corrinoid protein reductive activase
MARIGIALDLGTSGFRGQALDLGRSGAILSTAITARHPLPGANVIDHLHVALELGLDWAHDRVIEEVNRVIEHLGIPKGEVVRLAVCGNPIQLSLFQEIEIRDLAYAGQRKLEALGVVAPKRDARALTARDVRGLDLPPGAEVLVPPAVRHEIGADALAMMIRTGLLERDEVAIVTDYGTNAEMALAAGGIIYTGSTAAGPALEGQQIECGMLALPGAICDVELTRSSVDSMSPSRSRGGRLETRVLDQEMEVRRGDTVDPVSGDTLDRGEYEARGITGTGVLALISEGLETGLIRAPRILANTKEIRLPNGLRFTELDLCEAGKAIGAVRAGHLTLCKEAGIGLEDIETAYMSGASGTYVDALKAQAVGLIPPSVRNIYQVGNTSLAMAVEIVRDPDQLWAMQAIADTLRQNHCMFATSKVFEKIYILELSHWTEGMPLDQYQKYLRKYGFPGLSSVTRTAQVTRTVTRDIPDLGPRGLTILPDSPRRMTVDFEACIGCGSCVIECPHGALELARGGEHFSLSINPAWCNGVACRRCERSCKEKVFNLVQLLTTDRRAQAGGPHGE